MVTIAGRYVSGEGNLELITLAQYRPAISYYHLFV
jgi:hypothetical protein